MTIKEYISQVVKELSKAEANEVDGHDREVELTIGVSSYGGKVSVDESSPNKIKVSLVVKSKYDTH